MPQISPRLMLNFKKTIQKFLTHLIRPFIHTSIKSYIQSFKNMKYDSIMQQCPQSYVQTHNNQALIPIVGCGKIFCAPDQIGKTKLAEA